MNIKRLTEIIYKQQERVTAKDNKQTILNAYQASAAQVE